MFTRNCTKHLKYTEKNGNIKNVFIVEEMTQHVKAPTLQTGEPEFESSEHKLACQLAWHAPQQSNRKCFKYSGSVE